MPRRKKSEIWENYFESPDSRAVTCKYCGLIYKVANVSKMSQHLLKCFNCPTVVRNKLLGTSDTNTSSTFQLLHAEFRAVTALQQYEMSQDNQSKDKNNKPTNSLPGISAEKKQQLDQLLTKAILVTGSPLSMVEHPLWVELFKELQPQYELPTREAILTTLEAVYNQIVEEITEELKPRNYLHLQCDQRNLDIINLFVATPDPIIVASYFLTDRGTCEYISAEIIKVINTFGSQKLVTLIGDNDENIQKSFRIVQDSYSHVLPLRCVARTLDLLCEDCFKPEPFKACISIACDIIKAIKLSQTTSDLFDQIQDKKSGETLILPDKTRWSSYYSAIQSLKNSKVALQTLAGHKYADIPQEITSNILDFNFWAITEQCIKLLQPINDKIAKLKENGILVSDVYMTFRDIQSAFNVVLPEISTLDDQHKRDIVNAVTSRTNECVKPIHYAAYLLDPRYQGIELNKEHEVEAMEFIHDVSELLNIDASADLANYKAKHGIWSKPFIWQCVRKIEPVVWWKGLCSSYLLSKIAISILNTPCTSSASERYFRTQAHKNILKNGLSTDSAGKIAFISYNWHVLNGYYEDDEEEGEDLLTPKTSPIDDQKPSTSCRSFENIEFCDVTYLNDNHNATP